MTFREALDEHLSAIQRRDLQALAATVAEDEVVLITSDGRLVRSAREMLEMHRGWFEMTGWTLDVTPIHVDEAPGMGVAVLHLVYREAREGVPPLRQESYLTLVFREKNWKWVMTQDQNTPIQPRP
jgi:ketosteroid isomerase-like protein